MQYQDGQNAQRQHALPLQPLAQLKRRRLWLNTDHHYSVSRFLSSLYRRPKHSSLLISTLELTECLCQLRLTASLKTKRIKTNQQNPQELNYAGNIQHSVFRLTGLSVNFGGTSADSCFH